MTPNCVKAVDNLQQESEAFNDLTVEQLLFAAICGAGLNDVKYVLEKTDWAEFCANVANAD